MLSPPKQTSLRKLWETCAADGQSPTTTVEQISYLLLLKRLSELESEGIGDDANWEAIVALAGQNNEQCLAHLRDSVFPWLRHKDRETSLPGVHSFLQHAHLAFSKPTLLAAALAGIDALFPPNEQGQHATIYDRLLSMEEEAIASSAGPTGRIFTPDHISKLLCLLVDVRGDDFAWEPSCGNGHLLSHLYRTMQRQAGASFSPEQIYGCDLDGSVAFEAWMRLFLLGIRSPRVEHTDTLGSHFYESRLLPANGQGFASVVLANPPFSGVTDKADIGKSLKGLGTTKTELLFLEGILQALRPGGRAAIIVPEGLLFGSTKAHRSLRRRLLSENHLVVVVSLPQGVFLPWTNIKTDILLFEKGGTPTEEVFFYEVRADGFRQTARRDPDPDHDDLLDLLMRVRLRTASAGKTPPAEIDRDLWERWVGLPPEMRTQAYIRSTSRWDQDEPYTGEIVEREEPRSWTTALERVTTNGHDLRPGGYKPFLPPKIEYEDPGTIIRKLIGLEDGILRDLQTIEAMLGDSGSTPREQERPVAQTAASDTAGAAVPPQAEHPALNGHPPLSADLPIEREPASMRSPERTDDPAREAANLRPCSLTAAIPTGNPMIDAVVASYFTPWEMSMAQDILSHKEGGYPQASVFLASQARRRLPDRSILPQGFCYTTARGMITINDVRTPEKNPPDLQLSVTRLIRLAFPPPSARVPRQLALW